jgi:hypothetical protein
VSDEVQQPEQEPIINVFDIAGLRENPIEDVAVEQVMLSIHIRKPGNQEWFRVHGDPAYVVDCLLLEVENGMDRERYWVAPQLRMALLEESKRVRLFTCINRRRVPFLWPAKLPTPDGGGRQWAISALAAAERAKTDWCRIRGNKDAGSYDLWVAKEQLEEPKWPDKTYQELVELAFDGKVISSPDHRVIRELQGKE